MFVTGLRNNAGIKQINNIQSNETILQDVLEDVARRIANELETLGYEVARERDPRIACSLFILATDVEKRLQSLAERSRITEAA